jgi:hypothetical protein
MEFERKGSTALPAKHLDQVCDWLAVLDHPNILPTRELGVDAQKRIFFTMKMVNGRTLAQILTVAKLNQDQPSAGADHDGGRRKPRPGGVAVRRSRRRQRAGRRVAAQTGLTYESACKTILVKYSRKSGSHRIRKSSSLWKLSAAETKLAKTV